MGILPEQLDADLSSTDCSFTKSVSGDQSSSEIPVMPVNNHEGLPKQLE